MKFLRALGVGAIATLLTLGVGDADAAKRKKAPPPEEAAAPAPLSLPLVAPEALVIYLHDTAKTAVPFDQAIARLRAMTATPIETGRSAIDLVRSFDVDRKQYFGPQIAHSFHEWRWAQDQKIRILIINEDIYDEPLPYMFLSGRGELRVIIVSTARLRGQGEPTDTSASPELLAERLHKVLLKALARSTNLTSLGCVLARASTVADLDKLPADYCAEDTEKLRGLGVLKPLATSSGTGPQNEVAAPEQR